MRFSIPLLVFAAGALTSPMEAGKRDANGDQGYGYGYGYGYDYGYGDNDVSLLTEVGVLTATPPGEVISSAPVPVDLSTHRRNRHTYKNGSPGPVAPATPTTSSLDILEVSVLTVTLDSFYEVATSKVEQSTSTLISTSPPLPSSITPTALSFETVSLSALTTSLTSTSVTLTKLTSVVATTSSVPTSPSPELTSAVSAALTSTSITAISSKSVISDQSVQPPTTFVPDLDPASPTFKAIVIQHHNIHRHNHSAPDLIWDDKLAEYAETTAKTCKWGHNITPGGGGYGQNIAAGIQAGNISAILSNNFYNDELPRYPEFGTSSPDLTLFEEWGHFSQLVWKATLSVGCYTEICSPPGADPLDCKSDDTSYLNGLACGNGGIPAIFTVCNYDPPGNYVGGYLNVTSPEEDPHVYVNGDGVQGL